MERAGGWQLEGLLDEAYLLILTRRPTAVALARELGVPRGRLDGLLRKLSVSIKESGLGVAGVRRGKGLNLEIRFLKGPGKAVGASPETLAVRKIPPRRPGLKPEDEIIYVRDW